MKKALPTVLTAWDRLVAAKPVPRRRKPLGKETP